MIKREKIGLCSLTKLMTIFKLFFILILLLSLLLLLLLALAAAIGTPHLGTRM
jgi:hypothetical protein